MNKLTFLTLALATSALTASAQRNTINLKTWQFSRDSVNYKPVSIPHDWAINGPFDKKWDLQFVAIEQNGETEKTEKSGRSGALPWIGRGFYKTTIDLKKLPKTAVLEFDGASVKAASAPVKYRDGKKYRVFKPSKRERLLLWELCGGNPEETAEKELSITYIARKNQSAASPKKYIRLSAWAFLTAPFSA